MKLEIDHNRRPFRPGDVMTGHMLLSPQDDCVQKTHLILEGRAKTKTREKHGESTAYYRARAPLLYHVEIVEIPPALECTDHYNRRIVPFTLTIPSEVPKDVKVPTTKDGLFKSYWNTDWGKPKPNFRHDAGHSLPPTFKAGPRGICTKSECYVEYSVTAVGSWMEPQSGQYQGLSEAPLEPVRFDTKSFWMQSVCPLPPSYQVSTCETRQTAARFHIQSLRLLPAVSAREKPGKLTLKERWKSMTSSTSLPDVVFTSAIKLPTYLVVGDPLPLTLGFKRVDQATATNNKHPRPSVPFPDVQVESVEIKLKSTTHVRTCGTLKMHYDHWLDTVWTDTQTHGFMSTALPTWVGESPPAYIPPTTTITSPDHKISYIPGIEEFAQSPLRTSTNTSTTSTAGVGTATFDLQSHHALPDRLIPSFQTFNISRAYDLRVSVALSCAGEKKFVNFNGPVELYSQPREDPNSYFNSRAKASSVAPAYRDFSTFDQDADTDSNADAGANADEDANLASEVVGLSFVGSNATSRRPATPVAPEDPMPPERVDSGFSGATASGSRHRKGIDAQREEDWGEYKLTADDKLNSQKLAGIAVGGLGFVGPVIEVAASLSV